VAGFGTRIEWLDSLREGLVNVLQHSHISGMDAVTYMLLGFNLLVFGVLAMLSLRGSRPARAFAYPPIPR
jgi:hypothetical protein